MDDLQTLPEAKDIPPLESTLELSDRYKLNTRSGFSFDPRRVFVRLEKFGEHDQLISGHGAFVLCYRLKPPNQGEKRICKLGFVLDGNKITCTQLQGVRTSKAKEFFHTMDVGGYLRDIMRIYARKNGFSFLMKFDTNGVEGASEMARERLFRLLQY